MEKKIKKLTIGRGEVTIIRDSRVLPVNKDALCSCTLNVDALEKMLKRLEKLAGCSSFEKLHSKKNQLQFIRKTVCFS